MIGKDVYRKSAEIGYFIGEQYCNKGIASKAVKLLTDYGFNELKIIRIHTGIFEYNKASMSVLEKCGYKKIVCLRSRLLRKARFGMSQIKHSRIHPYGLPSVVRTSLAANIN